jgi:hypothetical protein
MIPAFDANGNLPPGIYDCDWTEFATRFGFSAKRLQMMSGLKKALLEFQKSGCQRVYIDGSFAASKLEPGDYDACWEEEGVDFALLDPILINFDSQRFAQKVKYFGELFPAWLPADTGGRTYLNFFQTDRDGNPKGIVAIDPQRLPK